MELFTIGNDGKKHYNWPLIYEDQKNSGLNICRYCMENEISEPWSSKKQGNRCLRQRTGMLHMENDDRSYSFESKESLEAFK